MCKPAKEQNNNKRNTNKSLHKALGDENPMNTLRNVKSCVHPVLSVGIKAKVTTNCPPDLTDSVKVALLKEIAEFDAQKAKQDAEVSADGAATQSAYQDWLEQNEGNELPEANPDIMAEGEGINYLPYKKDNTSVALLTEFHQSLTVRERQVWNLMMKHQYSRTETASLLKLNPRNVMTYLKRARIKFRKFGESLRRV